MDKSPVSDVPHGTRGWRMQLTGSIRAEADHHRPTQKALMQRVSDAVHGMLPSGACSLGTLELMVQGRDGKPRLSMQNVLGEVGGELDRQSDKWGEQNHPLIAPIADMNSPEILSTYYCIPTAARAKFSTDWNAEHGNSNWVQIALEELAEFMEAGWEAERAEDPTVRRARLLEARTELMQLSAVAAQAMGAIDRRLAREATVAADEIERLSVAAAEIAMAEVDSKPEE